MERFSCCAKWKPVNVRISTERTRSPKGGRGIGLFVAGLMFLGLAVLGALLWWFARKPSPAGLLIVTLVMLYPIILLAAGTKPNASRLPDGRPLDSYLKDWKDSVFGEYPPGCDQVRSAIAGRRDRALAYSVNLAGTGPIGRVFSSLRDLCDLL